MTERLCARPGCTTPLTGRFQDRYCSHRCAARAPRRSRVVWRGRALNEHHPLVKAAFLDGYRRGYTRADRTFVERSLKRQAQHVASAAVRGDAA